MVHVSMQAERDTAVEQATAANLNALELSTANQELQRQLEVLRQNPFVRAQLNKRLKETLRARISSVIFQFFWPRQGNLLGIRVIRKLVKKPRGKCGKEDKDLIRFPGSRSC